MISPLYSRIFSSLRSSHFVDRVGNEDTSSRFQEVGMEYVNDPTSLAAGAIAVPPSVFTLLSSDQDANFENEDGKKTDAKHLRTNYSSPSSYLTRSPISPSGSGSLSGDGSDLGDYFTMEPDLQMSRANWWQVLVTIYHPNPEIGTKLVMGDILHL